MGPLRVEHVMMGCNRLIDMYDILCVVLMLSTLKKALLAASMMILVGLLQLVRSARAKGHVCLLGKA
jgi:hypothetical protein